MKAKVYVTRQIFDKAMDILKREADVEVFEGVDNPAPHDVIISHVRDIDGLLCLLTDNIDSNVIEAGKNLKVISNFAVGFNNIDVETSTKRGIYVTNTPGILTETTEDLAFALLMTVARRVAEADHHVKSGKWVHAWGLKMFLGSDVQGKTIGIIGLGRIGKAIAKRAKGFDMNIIYYDVFYDRGLEDELDMNFKELDEVLVESDFITIHVPLTDDTHHLIGKKSFL